MTRRFLKRAVGVFYRPYVDWRIARHAQIRLFGLRLRTDARVFNPQYFLSTAVMVDHLAGCELAGRNVLEMGTGSGAVALFAHSRGARVTACDVNPHAVALAQANAALNRAAIEVIESDLFGAPALAGRTFDLIAFNVPFYAGQPRTALDHAFFAGDAFDTIRRFAADSPRFLAPGGTVVVLFSEDSGHGTMVSIMNRAGLAVTGEEMVRKLFERFHVLRLKPTASAV